MKLDKIKFARLIAYVQLLKNNDIYAALQDFQVEHLDNLIDVDVPVNTVRVSERGVNELLKAIADCNKIEAIKAYRNLTGAGLKESKDEVEKHWIIPKSRDMHANLGTEANQSKEATLGDILATATK